MNVYRTVGETISMIFLAIIFFCIFTPIALLMRYKGRDKLRLRLIEKNSHWISRTSKTSIGSFRRQS